MVNVQQNTPGSTPGDFEMRPTTWGSVACRLSDLQKNALLLQRIPAAGRSYPQMRCGAACKRFEHVGCSRRGVRATPRSKGWTRVAATRRVAAHWSLYTCGFGRSDAAPRRGFGRSDAVPRRGFGRSDARPSGPYWAKSVGRPFRAGAQVMGASRFVRRCTWAFASWSHHRCCASQILASR